MCGASTGPTQPFPPGDQAQGVLEVKVTLCWEPPKWKGRLNRSCMHSKNKTYSSTHNTESWRRKAREHSQAGPVLPWSWLLGGGYRGLSLLWFICWWGEAYPLLLLVSDACWCWGLNWIGCTEGQHLIWSRVTALWSLMSLRPTWRSHH